jgi:hypothetical protein
MNVFLCIKGNQIYFKIGDKVIHRAFVPLEKKPWNVPWSDYNPTNFSIDFTGKTWADLDIK